MIAGTWARFGAALLLVVGGFGIYQGRRAFIRSFFVDGAPRAIEGEGAGPPAGEPLPASERVRVVLLDGLGREEADAVPALDELCAGGWDLEVDVGFPTVSLPVQHVLWTSLTQAQSGILYRIAGLGEAPAAALPRRTPGSVAVAEAHPEIIHSFGFSRAEPAAAPADAPSGWREGGFEAAARAAVTGDARLAFVHVLRIDEAGHASGAASPAYAAAVQGAGELLAGLVAAEAALGRAGTRWFVLADHGHRPAGGHGGAEESIRVVRACVVGDLPAAPAGPRPRVHLVDLGRMLAESVGAEVDRRSVARPWARALGEAAPPIVPAPSAGRRVLAAILGAAGLALTRRLGSRSWSPWIWPVVAYAGIVIGVGPLSLSNPAVYPPLGASMVEWAAPGLVILLVHAILLARGGAPLGRFVAALGGVGTFAAVSAVLAGIGENPPLAPVWTAHASAAFAVSAAASLVVGLVLAVSSWAWWVRSRRQ